MKKYSSVENIQFNTNNINLPKYINALDSAFGWGNVFMLIRRNITPDV